MPELPEVETMRRGVARLKGGKIVAAEIPTLSVQPIKYSPPAHELCRHLEGRLIKAVDRIGKRLLLRLDGKQVLLIEPRMTGRVLVDPPTSFSHTRLQLIVALPGKDGESSQHILVYRDTRGLGVVRLISEAQCRSELGPKKIGPDALEITWRALRERLKKRRCAIKIALMDQSVLAGVGNIYASEALHRAKIHPALPCFELSDPQWQALTTALQRVLREAIRLQGSTLGDGTYTTPENSQGRYQNRHRVYQRDGERCRQCRRGLIRRIVLGQRSTFYCPVCQRMPRDSRGRS